MAISNLFDAHLLADDAGLDTSGLIRDYAKELLGSSDLDNLSPAELQIVDATFHAVAWGYPLQETYRLRKLDTELQAPINKLFKPSYAANWLNKNSSPAPNPSVLYVTGWLDLSGSNKEQVLWVPSNTDDNFFVWAILDSYINTVGSIGPRTQSSSEINNGSFYLLAGPSSSHYKSSQWDATIKLDSGEDKTIPVIKVDTPYAWFTARFGSDTLSATGLAATRQFINGDSKQSQSGFQLGSLSEFQQTGAISYKAPISNPSSDGDKEKKYRALYGRVPEKATTFFEQLGQSLIDNPVPAERTTAPSHIPDRDIWLGNQNSVQQAEGANDYIPDSDYQPSSALTDLKKIELNDRFAHIGLNLSNGFTEPSNWTNEEKDIFQLAYTFSQKLLSKATTEQVSGNDNTNYWDITNLNIGVYPNQWKWWLVRAGAAIDGGAANIPNDAVYPTTQSDSKGKQLTSTYNYKIEIPPLSYDNETVYGPADGFWSYTIYQPNSGNAYQPFLIENAISNRSYSPVNSSATLRADGWLLTTKPENWNQSTAKGTALYTGKHININGLKRSTTYYVSESKEISGDKKNILIKVSDHYDPDLNWLGINGQRGVPIGGQGSTGPSLQLSGATGSTQSFGWINPVSNLGSAQLSSLQTNGSNNIELQLRANQPQSDQSNWLPTPNSGYAKAAYEFQVMGRYYQPITAENTSGTDQTILATAGSSPSSSLYLPPPIKRTSLNRIALWEDLDQAGQDLLLDRTGSSSVDLFDIEDPFDADAIGALLDLRWADGAMEGTTWTLSYTYERQAYYTNSLYFYTVDTVTGMINGKNPGDLGYTDMAMSRRINPNDPIMNYNSGSTVSGSLELSGGSIYMPLVITEPGQILIPNSRSTDGYTHFKLEGDRGFVFEDLKKLGDHDYNDGMFTVTELTPLA